MGGGPKVGPSPAALIGGLSAGLPRSAGNSLGAGSMGKRGFGIVGTGMVDSRTGEVGIVIHPRRLLRLRHQRRAASGRVSNRWFDRLRLELGANDLRANHRRSDRRRLGENRRLHRPGHGTGLVRRPQYAGTRNALDAGFRRERRFGGLHRHVVLHARKDAEDSVLKQSDWRCRPYFEARIVFGLL